MRDNKIYEAPNNVDQWAIRNRLLTYFSKSLGVYSLAIFLRFVNQALPRKGMQILEERNMLNNQSVHANLKINIFV